MMCTRAIGSLPSQAADELGHDALVGDLADDAEQRGLLVRLLRVGGVEQLAHVEARLLRGDHVEHRGLSAMPSRQSVEQQSSGG